MALNAFERMVRIDQIQALLRELTAELPQSDGEAALQQSHEGYLRSELRMLVAGAA